MNQSKKSNPGIPILNGTPRVHYDELEYIEKECCLDEWAYYYKDKLFTGIAWSELKGVVAEDTLEKGVRNGRCVRVHANGTLAEDGYYQEDEPVGELFSWDETGSLLRYSKYDDNARCLLKREYNSQGVMVKEVDELEEFRLRHWSAEGALVYESATGFQRCFAPNGNCVIEEGDRGKPEERKPTVYSDEELYEHAFEMLSADIQMVEYPVFRWLNQQLDQGDIRALNLLYTLLEHPLVSIAESALYIIGARKYQEAIPLVRKMTESTRCKAPGAGGFIGTTAELAKITLMKLTGKGNVEQAIDGAWEKRKERGSDWELRLLSIKDNWPEIKAEFKETFIGQATLETADQLFSGEAAATKLDYIHLYRYVVDGRTYHATVTSSSQEPLPFIDVRYKTEKPEEYIIDAE
ncbi:hypothetical protein AAG747_25815 [Rapidithrix thailandica]|uniref:Uncharacterized protein n=1 Tax=Rapidithrix thailandica TaxID=413964 RepID=A0AAW9SGA4_9BACT